MEVKFPFQVVEILNGILTVALFWMLVFLVIHLYHAWRVMASHWGNNKGFWKLWKTNKPEIALFTIISAFFVRSGVLWYLRWARNHHFDGMVIVAELDAEILIVFTAIMLIGIACWIRVISPFAGRQAFWLWSGMLVSSLTFGLGMHYWF